MTLAAAHTVPARLSSLKRTFCLDSEITRAHILFVATDRNRAREAFFQFLSLESQGGPGDPVGVSRVRSSCHPVVRGWFLMVNVYNGFIHMTTRRVASFSF